MTLNQFIVEFDNMINRITNEFPKMFEISSGDISALIENRVVQTGKTATGGKFSNYSITETYINTSKPGIPRKVAPVGKTGETKFKNGEPHKTTYFKNGYKGFRSSQGRVSNFKNFELTGEMWRGFGVENLQKTATGAKAELGGKTGASQDKIDWMSDQEDRPIIKPSKKEIEMISVTLQQRVIKRIKELL